MKANFILSRGILACLCISVVVGPWFFGAWEMWWFWPFVAPIFVALLLFGLKLILGGCAGCEASRPAGPGEGVEGTPVDMTRRHLRLLLSAVPFLLYASFRYLSAPVYIDAERSFLLFLTSWLLVMMVVFGLGASERRWLFGAICINLVLMALYGLINHQLTESRLVLWADGFEKYFRDDRASGCYFCPDHFSGVMEIAACLGLGFVFGGGLRMHERLGGLAMTILGVAGIMMSKSRGGGITFIVILVAVAIWGLTHLPREARWWWRLSACSAVLMLVLLLASTAGPYMNRFGAYFGGKQLRGKSASEVLETAKKHVVSKSRPQMYGAAYRAWRSAPWMGIGPGMHESLWPHFGPTADGDPASGKWPSRLNLEYTSNEVHNDWLELLEEYGVVGFVLFLLPFGLLVREFHGSLKQDPRRQRIRVLMHEADGEPWQDAMVLGVFLAILAMTFHSLGDFNLQIPATTWMMATLTGLGLSAMGQGASREPAT